MIYYHIQHHGNTQQQKWLAPLLQDGRNILRFSLDVDKETYLAFSQWTNSHFNAGVRVERSIPITWCGPSQITQMRDMLETAINVAGWEYFVNLSGSCFPVYSQKFIKEFLRTQYRSGKSSFCVGFRPNKEEYWLENDPEESDKNYYEYKYIRLNLKCNLSAFNAFSDGSLNPVKNIMQRRALFCSEIADSKDLTVRGLEKWEIRDRQVFWKKTPYFVGRTWMVLHRKQVEWLVESPLMQDLYYHLINTFEPDETLFPSLLFSRHNPCRSELSVDNLRYRKGTPGMITGANLDDVFTSRALFARKLARNVSDEVLERIRNKIIHS